MSENPDSDSVSPSPDPRVKMKIDDRFRFYQTRCNICGSKRPRSSIIYFFTYDGHELRCCTRCKKYAPGDITRLEYRDRIYEEPDVDSSLWRYIDIAKFIDMILFKRLWLSQVASLDDPFEGALGAKVRQKDWQEAMQSLLFHAVKQPPPGNAKQVSDEYARQEAARLLDDLEHSLPAQKLNTYVNCWHIARHESVLMWKVYAKDRPDSVCIKTNLANIRRCLDDQFHVGVVNYIDFRSEPPDINWPFLYKRAAYLQESEARIFVRCPNSLQWGFHVDIDPAVLIEEVLISPEAPVWMTENITRVIELSGVPIACRVSDLSEEPF